MTMKSSDFQTTKLNGEIDLAWSWTGGTSPVAEDGSTKTVSTITYAATGKFTITLNPTRPRKAFGIPKMFVYVQPAAGSVTDANMKVIPQSYDPVTGILVLWCYGPTASGDSTPILTAPAAGTTFNINFRGAMHKTI